MLGWSPDSRHFLVNDGEYIWLLPIDGAARQLLKFDPLAYYIQNWSPNGEYLLMIGNDSADYTLKRVTILPVDPQQPTVINDVRVFNQYVEWSPDGKNVIIFAQADDGQQVVHFAALDGSVSYDYGIPDGMTPASTPVIWSTHRRTIALYLRPETEEKPQSIMLIGLDGTVLPVATIPQDELVQLRYQSPLEPNMTALHWSADDTQFRYWADNTLYAFDTRTHTTQTLYAPPEANFDMQTVYYVPNVNRLLVYTQQTNHTWAEVLSLSGEVLARFDLPSLNFNNLMPHDWLISSSRVVVPLIDVNARNWHIINLQALWTKPLLPPNVADMGEPSWSPQSNFVAITWSDMLALPEQFNPKRRVYLTWMNTNTGDMMTLDDAFYSVYDVVWAADEQYLIYTAWRESGTTIEKLNLQTGETQPIIEGENAHHIQWDAVQQRLTLWREVGSQFPAMQLDIEHRPLPTTPTPSAGDWQYEGYTLAGEKVFAFLLPNAKPDWSRIFPAPDGSVVIAKTIGGGFDSQALHVLDLATNSTSIVTQDLKGLGDPVWSPDGNLIMYTQWTQDRMLSINLIDRTSRPIWSQPLETLHVFDWQQCE
jgi:Tol biopolymer transport system component